MGLAILLISLPGLFCPAPGSLAGRQRVCITPRMLDDDAARWYAEQYGLTSQPAAPSSGTAELAAMPWSTPVGEGIELAFAVDTSLAVEQLEQLRRSQPAANLRECELEMVENEEYIQVRGEGNQGVKG